METIMTACVIPLPKRQAPAPKPSYHALQLEAMRTFRANNLAAKAEPADEDIVTLLRKIERHLAKIASA